MYKPGRNFGNGKKLWRNGCINPFTGKKRTTSHGRFRLLSAIKYSQNKTNANKAYLRKMYTPLSTSRSHTWEKGKDKDRDRVERERDRGGGGEKR